MSGSQEAKYTRLFEDDDGESHFEEIEVELEPTDYAPPAPPLSVGAAVAAKQWLIGQGAAGWEGDWHPSPVRQLMVVMSGQFVSEASDGERRTFTAGSVLLLEDTEGKGHRSWIPPGEPSTVFIVHLE